MRTGLRFLAAILILVSCINEKDYDFRNVQLSPSVAIPVAFGEMGLLDLLSEEDSAFIRAYPDGLLYFYYQQSLNSADIRGRFDIPDKSSTTSFDLPPGTLPASSSTIPLGSINGQVDFGFAPERLTEIALKSGALNYSLTLSKVTSPPNLPLEATITLLDVVHQTTQQPLTITLGNGSGSAPLKDYVIHLLNNRFNFRIDVAIKPHPTTFILANTKADVQMNFMGMEFSYIRGFLGDQIVPLPPQSMDISVFSSSLKDANVSFADPKLTLSVVNDYGVGCEVSFSVLRAKKGTAVLPFQTNPTNPINLNFPTVLGQSATTQVNVVNSAAVLNFAPEALEYAASVRINKGLVTANNFLADTSKLRVNLITEIPIYGRVSGVTMADTVGIDLGDIKEATVQSSSLKVSGRNELPLDARVQIYLTDENFQLIDSLFAPHQTYLVKASQVDGAGDLQSPGVSELSLALDPDRVNDLFSSKYLIIKAVLSTAVDANNAPLNVKFRSSYKLRLSVGLLSKLNITID